MDANKTIVISVDDESLREEILETIREFLADNKVDFDEPEGSNITLIVTTAEDEAED